MASFRKILVGLDLGPARQRFSAGSRIALDAARRLASAEDTSLHLLHAIHDDEYWDAEQEQFVFSAGRLPEAGREALEQAARGLRADGIDAELEIVEGEDPAGALIRRAREGGFGLVMASKRSHGPSHTRRFGSVSLKLLRHCPRAVWVVQAGSSLDLRCVLVATDLRAAGDEAVRAGAHVAGLFGAALHVVHAFQIPLSVQMEGDAAREAFTRGEARRTRERIEALLAEEGRDASGVWVGADSPSAAILSAIERFTPDLLVMGSVSRSGVAGLLMGNTAERVLFEIEGSLLVVKPDGGGPEALARA